MSRALALLAAALAAAVALVPVGRPTTLEAAQPGAKSKRVAFLVGVNKPYKPGFEKLDFAERDVTEMKKVLEEKLKFDKVVALTGENATAAAIDARLKELVKPLGENDTILVLLSGHGLQFDRGNGKEEAFFCPFDTIAPELDKKQFGENLYPMERLLDTLKANVGTKLVLVDACRTEPKLAGKGGIEGTDEFVVPKGTAVFFSCSAREQSWENPKAGGGHSVFTHCVLEGLKGEAVQKGVLSWDGLVGYVKTRMGEDEVKKLLQKPQSPVQSVKGLGQVVLAKNDSGDTAKDDLRAGEERSFEIADGVKMVFCWIPPGEVQLGSPKAERDAVLKLIKEEKEPEWLASEAEDVRGKFPKGKGFWLGKYTVTQKEWKEVMGDNPSYFDGTKENEAKGLDTTRFPVENVSWDDCKKFLVKVNARASAKKPFGQAGEFVLPHENEWEYAARGGKGNKQAFYFGDELNGTQANCNGKYPFGTDKEGAYKQRTTEVGSYAKDWPHPWNLCDMHGNVYQWCENKYSQSNDSPVVRGGSWSDLARNCRGVP